MANELQHTLTRLLSKSSVFVEKYHVLERQNAHLVQENEQLTTQVTELKQQLELMRRQMEYLKLARVLSPNLDDVEEARKTISDLVRDIDTCIAQLNE